MKRILFLGQRQIAWKALEVLASRENELLKLAVLVTDPDTYVRVQKELPTLAPRHIANDKRRVDEILRAIREEDIDLLISVQHNWILSKEILDAVGGRAFNLHNARLPHYQGYNSISHAILHGDKSYYSTLHWMEEEVDSGAIAFEGITSIEPSDTAMSLHRKTIGTAIEVFKQFVSSLDENAAIPRKKLEAVEAKYFGKNSLQEIMDVSNIKNADELDLLARALFYPPHNMAYLVSGGRKTYLVPQAGIADLLSVGFPHDR